MTDLPGGDSASDSAVTGTVSFPRLNARTARFTLGEPRSVTVTGDGATVLFLRTASGVDRSGALWAFDVATATERVLADPAALLGDADEKLPDAERARRERSRESGVGVVSYSVDSAGRTAVFALSGALWVCNVGSGRCRALPVVGEVIDPRVDPTGLHVAYASDGALRVVAVDGTGDRALVEPDRQDPAEAEIVWGQAEFVAAEEMDRYRGFWWAPDGKSLLVERYDNTPVRTWYLADPANPDREPVRHRYPAAGTPNADVSLWHVTLAGERRRVPCTDAAFPYLARVSWQEAGPLVQVLSRDQRTGRILAPDLRIPAEYAADPTCRLLLEAADAAWIDLVVGLPALAPGGRLLAAGIDTETDTHRLLLDGTPLTPPGMQLRAVLSVTETAVLATVSTEALDQQLVLVGFDGTVRQLSDGAGVHSGAIGGSTVVIASARLDRAATEHAVVVLAAQGSGEPAAAPDLGEPAAAREAGRAPALHRVGILANRAVSAQFLPRVAMLAVGERALRTAVILPREHVPGSTKLPVIMAPYGGPHGQLVRSSGRMLLQAQWLADQGFAVVVADGRGTPGRGPAWERAVRDDLASITLQDQVDALVGAAAAFPDDLNKSRVGIMGWSYGGYLAALAVLDRPDVFHAAVAGAPVTDWTLYDTCYTERYLGLPGERPEVYERNSLTGRARQLTRPLMLIHGLADDNVVVAHTLRLSGALLAAGKAHEVLPLTGITHMASDEIVAENLLLAQVDFFRRTLG